MKKPVLVVFATRQGHTEEVARRIGITLRDCGDPVDTVHASEVPPGFDAARYGGALLLASVHLGKHEREMVRFVKQHLSALEHVPTAFLSVSLSEASVEDETAPFETRAKAAEDVRHLVESFCLETGLHPSRIWPIAGALTFSRYGALTGFVMRRVAKASGIHDVTHDHDFTDWRGLDRFVRTMAEEIDHAA
jgi:menaquinone-dependent protoporphyrinogen oxidase